MIVDLEIMNSLAHDHDWQLPLTKNGEEVEEERCGIRPLLAIMRMSRVAFADVALSSALFWSIR